VDALVPTSKYDTVAAERAVKAGWPAVEPVVEELLEWLRDINWPVARLLAPFLGSVGTPLVPYVRPILRGDDAMWKYWIVATVIADSPLEVVAELRDDLQSLAANPDTEEADAGVPEVALEALARL
jgi:hypothetical protein